MDISTFKDSSMSERKLVALQLSGMDTAGNSFCLPSPLTIILEFLLFLGSTIPSSLFCLNFHLFGSVFTTKSIRIHSNGKSVFTQEELEGAQIHKDF
jgi:hypothetical protein